LDQWDTAYFKRLRDFVGKASRCGVVVELNLFCPFYDESQWRLSPMNAANNMNQVGAVARTNVYTLDRHGGLLAVQESMVRKIVTELNGFDNVYYEICNEPYFGGVTLAWQHQIADVIVATERRLPRQHLISQNIANGRARVEQPHPAVSILNFHYASPPDTVGLNYELSRVIGDNETGFAGTNDAPYRIEAWSFILAGGGLFNHLDYSFAVGHENGTFVYPAKQPGGGNPVLRRQFRVLRDFINGLDFVRMKPDRTVARELPPDCAVHVLTEPGRACALYLSRKQAPASPTGFPAPFSLALPPGDYEAAWLDPLTGGELKRQFLTSHGSGVRLGVPPFIQDIALRIVPRTLGARHTGR
jgi:hypothetical protein